MNYYLLEEKQKPQENLSPSTCVSLTYKHWISTEDAKRCFECTNMHGKIWLISEKPFPEPPLHPRCRCIIECMKAILVGTATINGNKGADWTLKKYRKLPNYYISKHDLLRLGWQRGKDISHFANGKMLNKGIYKNENGHLPQKEGRIWCEADINYIQGKRNGHRILWSNDGLVFVTYDHYKTFYEII